MCPEKERNMNISFHYFTIKTLCYYADIADERAQEIAFYSQFVDDFNLSEGILGSGFYVDEKPPVFFLENNLAKDTRNNTWYVYPVTTAISIAQTTNSLINKRHQLLTLIPFHFIPTVPISQIDENRDENYCCQQAEQGDGSLISAKLEGFLARGVQSDMKLGMLLHIYADTYAHQKFSGRQGYENWVSVLQATDRSVIPNIDVTSQVTKYRPLPAIGHAELGHVPDTFALSFNSKFDYHEVQQYARDNIDTFLLCAKRIWAMLRRYNNQTPLDENYFDTTIAPCIKRAGYQCVDGASEIMDTQRLSRIWKQEFPDCNYEYHYDPLWEREISDKSGSLYTYYRPSTVFYLYNQFAYEHIFEVIGKFRMEEEL